MKEIHEMTLQELVDELARVKESIASIEEQRNASPLTSEDREDVSDNYQFHLECSWELRDLKDRRDALEEKLFEFDEDGVHIPNPEQLTTNEEAEIFMRHIAMRMEDTDVQAMLPEIICFSMRMIRAEPTMLFMDAFEMACREWDV